MATVPSFSGWPGREPSATPIRDILPERGVGAVHIAPAPLRSELRTDLDGGRRRLHVAVGPYEVVVTEVPAASLSADEWHDVQLARCSYVEMWGGDRELIADDPLDGRDAASPYDVHHYLAWARVPGGFEGGKLLTMRKVRLVASRLTAEQLAYPLPLLPLDALFWRVSTAAGSVPLWEPLHDKAGFSWAAIGRTGTYPFGEPERSEVERERTGVAFAAIQLLAAHGDSSQVWVDSLCPEFRDRVLGVRDRDGRYVAPAFTRTEETLGLPPGSVSLDNDLHVVRQHKILFPGYFVDNTDATRVLGELLDDGLLTIADLRPSIGRLVEAESSIDGAGRQVEELVALGDHRRLAELLTRSRLFKYLAPLLAGAERPTRMSAADLRRRLLFETADGPFSSAVRPAVWSASALSVLLAVDGKYPRRCR
jgi:hypothetical protein